MLQQHTFGYWLRLKRKARDLTREALARQVSCSAETIRKIENEERRPSAQIIERLADIFNIPGAERKAFHRFARGDWQSAPSPPAEDTPWRAPAGPTRSNLPAPATSLVGREQETALVRGYLAREEIRLVTLAGPPGIGKTRLGLEAAREAAQQFHGGVFFVPLAGLDDPALIGPAVIEALGYVEAKNLPPEKQLAEAIGARQVLLVLDDCEHLVEGAAQLAAALLSACAGLKILATSREALRIPGEWLYSVPALAVPQRLSPAGFEAAAQAPALQLFAERARAARPGFALNAENIQAAAAICAQLDGLPLALELIAARVRFQSPQALLERLGGDLVLSADGRRAVAGRQKTLHNAIGWSYNLLSPAEQELFACLAAFSGGFSLETAEAVFSPLFPAGKVADLTASLSDKSLLQRDYDARGDARFHMLGTVQQFALSSLRQLGKEEDARGRHLAYFLDLAEQGAQEMRGPRQAAWSDRLESEHGNFRAALDWCAASQKTEDALRLLRALGWPWEVRGHYSEARGWLEKIRSLPGVADYPLIYAGVLNHIGRQCWTQGNNRDARALLEESRAIALALGPEGELSLAETLNWLGLVVLYVDEDRAAARGMFARSLALCQSRGDPAGAALSTFHLGIAESVQDDGLALSLLERSYSLFHQPGDLFFMARASLYLGYCFLRQGAPEKARPHMERQLALDQEIHFWDGIADGWFNLGNVHRALGEHDQAERCYDESLAAAGEHGLFKPDAQYLSGLLALRRGDTARAGQRFAGLLERAQRSEDRSSIGYFLLGAACAAAGSGQAERAAKLAGAAQPAIEAARSPYLPEEADVFEQHMQMAHAQLSEAAFTALQAAGRAMTLEQAVQLALKI